MDRIANVLAYIAAAVIGLWLALTLSNPMSAVLVPVLEDRALSVVFVLLLISPALAVLLIRRMTE
jgi:hypothetical protein